MKEKISISIEKDVLKKIEKLLDEGIFRNTSHAFEFALNKFVEERAK